MGGTTSLPRATSIRRQYFNSLLRVHAGMNLETFRSTFQNVRYGKRLPTALYLFRPKDADVPGEFWKLLRRAKWR